MMSLAQLLAEYGVALESCANATARSEDRPLYQALTADAAGLLAAAVMDGEEGKLLARIIRHERLWSHSWLQYPVFKKASNAWSLARKSSAIAI
ncbi:MAG: hypothetical protein LBU11_01375 [Zoogloeaceae bacterium]|jgi:hypothetical protein|nr:hypothetical protein [Zoogloeaceae bacterium]